MWQKLKFEKKRKNWHFMQDFSFDMIFYNLPANYNTFHQIFPSLNREDHNMQYNWSWIRQILELAQLQAKRLSKIISLVEVSCWFKMFHTIKVLLKLWNSLFSIAYVSIKKEISLFTRPCCPVTTDLAFYFKCQ